MTETGTDPLPPALRDGLDDYLLALRVEAGLSRSTLAAYESDLTLFLTWLSSRGVETYDALDTDTIVDWLAHRRDAGLAEATVARDLVATAYTEEEWAEWQQREHVKQAMRALEEGGAAVLMERIPAATNGIL